MLQERVDALNRVFLRSVAEGRGMPPSVVTGLATGQVWMAPAALSLGLIDKVMPKDDAFAALRDRVKPTGEDPTTALRRAQLREAKSRR